MQYLRTRVEYLKENKKNVYAEAEYDALNKLINGKPLSKSDEVMLERRKNYVLRSIMALEQLEGELEELEAIL